MKKAAVFLVLLCVLLSACGKTEIQNITDEDTDSSFQVGTEEETVSVDKSKEDLQPLYEEDEVYDPFDEELKHPETDDPMAISNLFGDPHFSYYIAEIFGKSVSDPVTFEELAAYDGVINIGPGVIKSIEGIGYLTGITGFSSAKNNIEELPDEFGKCVNIRSINLLKDYNLQRITPEIGKLTKLEFLRADLTELRELPREIGNCTELEVLVIDNTRITSIPEELGNCTQLKYLDVHGNKIDSLPASLGKLTRLEFLDISDLEIRSLFGGIENLKQLRIFNAGSNRIDVLPQEVCSLVKLERLDLFGWNLTSLPKEIKNLKNLKYLNVFDNFHLTDEYKNWFDREVYGCKNDPEHDEYWLGFLFPEKYP